MQTTSPETNLSICPSHSKPWLYICLPDPSKKLQTRFMCQECKTEDRKKYTRTEIVELGEARKLVLEQWGGFEGKREEIVEKIEGFYRELTEKMNEAIIEDKALTMRLIERLRTLTLPNEVKSLSFTNFISQNYSSVDPEQIKILLSSSPNPKASTRHHTALANLKLELSKLNQKIISMKYLLLGKKLQTDFLNPIRQDESKIGSINEFTRIGGIFNSREMMIRSMRLVYRGSDHGFEPEKFREACEGIGRCIVVAKTENNRIVGGYSGIPLASNTVEGTVEDKDRSSFLMNLSTIRTYSIISDKALEYSKQSAGPLFGQDLRLDLNVSSNLGNLYQTPDGIKPGTMEARFHLLNKEESKMVDFEVWKLAF